MTDAIADRGQASGEIFDLSIPTYNNKFGYEYIKGTITYGISLPLEKYIRELEMILYGGDPRDGKSEKRKQRLDFLRMCNKNRELTMLFPIFTNYLNGGGENSSVPNDRHGHRRNTFSDYNYQYNSNIIITVAGGNIVTTFGQLLLNMLDTFKKTVNKYAINPTGHVDNNYYKWDLKNNYRNVTYINDRSKWMANNMFETKFKDWHFTAINAIKEAFQMLTITNRILIEELSNQISFPPEKIYLKICKFILDINEKTTHGIHYNLVDNIAKSNYSDFDFKLSPNISVNSESTIDYLDEEWDKLPTDTLAGFVLVRVKSYIICNRFSHRRETLKEYKKDCYGRLSSDNYKKLYPQMVNSFMLGAVPPDSDCRKFIAHLLDEKKAIADATHDNVNEILNYFLSGYYKPSNIPGQYLPVIPGADNSTESMINYLYRTSFFLNMYIKYWEQKYNSPNYNTIILAFLGLKNVLDHSNYLIPKLSAGIINHFLNNPEMQTEAILDSIIASVNKKRAEKGYDLCHMPHSSLQLVSGNRDLTKGLREIKQVLEELMDDPDDEDDTGYDEDADYSETPADQIPLPPERGLGFPDGIRITMNAITTLGRTPDTFLDEVEIAEVNSMYGLGLNLSNYAINLTKGGGKNKLKRHKTKKHKKHNKSKKKNKERNKNATNNIKNKKNKNKKKNKKLTKKIKL